MEVRGPVPTSGRQGGRGRGPGGPSRPAAGGDAERLTRGSTDEFRGNLAPGGRELAYHSFETGWRRIFLLTLADGSIRQLPGATGQLAMANGSPEGSAAIPAPPCSPSPAATTPSWSPPPRIGSRRATSSPSPARTNPSTTRKPCWTADPPPATRGRAPCVIYSD